MEKLQQYDDLRYKRDYAKIYDELKASSTLDKFEVYLRFEAETMIKYTNIISEQNKSDGGRLPQKPELKEKSQDHPLTPPSKHQDNLLKLKQVSQGQEADLEEAKE